MENNILNLTHEDENTVVKSFLSKVFTWMLAALVISGTLAYAFANSLSLQQLILQVVDERIVFTPLGYIVMFAPLAFILIMNFGMEKLSLPLMLLIFVLFSAAMGMSLSTIMLRYSGALIVKTFFISAATFGIMAFLGATTKTDLSGMGSYLMMGLFGIIIASIINAFTGGGSSWIIDILGVIVFTGLTSYKVQMLKTMALSIPAGGEQTQKMAVYGALSLYLTFINLFLTLLRLGGGRR
jgi:FtsH-binding integral membrane protein